jgi:hypothetical protein
LLSVQGKDHHLLFRLQRGSNHHIIWNHNRAIG